MKGLTTNQANGLLKQHGLNVIEEQKKRTFIKILFEQFNNFLTILLISASILSFLIGSSVDGALILTIIILNAFFGVYQEKKAEESIASLKKMTTAKIRVIRDGKETEIDSKLLVPGDVIFIEEGTKIPADSRIIEAYNLELNEAVLTGESLPVFKTVKEEVFMGTIVVRGRAYGEIVNTGMKTKFGQIAFQLGQVKETKTPLQKKLESLSRTIGYIGLIAAGLVFVLSILKGSSYFSSFLLSIALAVAVVPEGLPAAMTIILSIGVKEMAKKKAILRKLSAIEALGSLTLIATDKTGTLTTNQMNVKEIYVDDHLYEENKPPSLTNNPFHKLILDGILCSTASLVYIHDHGKWDILGDPTEGSLLLLAQKMGLKPDEVKKEWRLIEEQPFDSVTKRMSVIVEPINNVRAYGNTPQQYVKGAPESILQISSKILIGNTEKDLTGKEREKIEKILDQWTKKGLRVLAFAYNNVFTGMVAIHDPARPEAKEAVQKAKQAGIKVVMITGDNEKTAESIGVATGIVEYGDEILTGRQLDQFTDQELMQKLEKVKIFARTTPFHKQRIVKLYQELGEIVAVTGDGVNDAIALKQADVGIAMGLVGTDVARETADMVITDDNFATIITAISEGRNITKNLTNAVKYLLSCNISEAAALILSLFLGIPSLFFPIQLLYINLVTDGIPALALSFSPKEEDLMKKSPAKDLHLLSNWDKKYISLIGALATFLVLFSYYFFNRFANNNLGPTAAFTVLALIQSFIFVDVWINHRHLHKHLNLLKKPIFLLAFITPFIAQYMIISIPVIARIFKITTTPTFIYFLFIIISSSVLIPIKLFYKRPRLD